MAAKDVLGKSGELLAARFLEAHGYRVVARNWRCKQGEIDIIARRDGQTVFVEVKTRSSVEFGHPFEAVTVGKRARLRRLAGVWCEQMGSSSRGIRIDAIAVIAPSGERPTIEHLEGIF